MKALITYYPYKGRTDRVAAVSADLLRAKGEVELQELKPSDDIKDFFGQRMAALGRKRSRLGRDVKLDASHYDLMVIISPLWAFRPVPAINAFLDKVNGLHGKRVAAFLTSASCIGAAGSFRNIRHVLESKGASTIDELYIPYNKNNKGDSITSLVKDLL